MQLFMWSGGRRGRRLVYTGNNNIVKRKYNGYNANAVSTQRANVVKILSNGRLNINGFAAS